jgi:hypothetical protein
VLAIASGLNFFVDPANIYRERHVTPQSYADALIRSEHGLYFREGTVDERLLAKALASKSFRADCVVIGSSHVTQISSERKSKIFQNICGSILNLGVSGGSIEDHFILSYLALQHRQKGRPSKVIFGVDPWTLAFGKDRRWLTNRDDYLAAEVEIQGTPEGSDGSSTDGGIDEASKMKLANLINLEYTIRSIKTIIRDFRSGAPTIEFAPELDTATGGDFPIRLRDNSHVYSAKYIAKSIGARIPFGGTIYATDGELNQNNAINAYRDMLLWIESKGVEPILLMTPYHENVLKAPSSINAIALNATEPIVLNLAERVGIKVIGSYDPKMFGCLSSEFFDFMHPTSKCLDKLRAR